MLTFSKGSKMKYGDIHSMGRNVALFLTIRFFELSRF